MKKGVFFILFFLLIIVSTHLFLKRIKETKESKETEKSPTKIISTKYDENREKDLKIEERKLEENKNLKPIEKKKRVSIEKINVSGYEGEFPHESLIIKATQAIDNSLKTSVTNLFEYSGLFPSDEDCLRIIISGKKDRNIDYPFEIKRDNDGCLNIYILEEVLVFNEIPLIDLLSSAIGEALLFKKVGGANLPSKFRKALIFKLMNLDELILKRDYLKRKREGQKFYFGLDEESMTSLTNCLILVELLFKISEKNNQEILKLLEEEISFKEFLQKVTSKKIETIENELKREGDLTIQNLSTLRTKFESILQLLRGLKEEEALEELKNFLEKNPSDVHYGEALYYYGYVNYRLGKYKEAEEIFTDLIENHSFKTISTSKAYYFLGRCLELRGFSTLASSEYRVAYIDKNELLRKVIDKKFKGMEQ